MASGFSSSGVAELALFQELHSTSTISSGHSTLLVPLAVVKGTGRRPFLFPLVSCSCDTCRQSAEHFRLYLLCQDIVAINKLKQHSLD